MADDVQNRGLAYRGLPATNADNSWANVRTNRYGEQLCAPTGKWRHALSDEGTYFVAHNNTIDLITTLAGHAAPVAVDADVTMTKPLIHLMMTAGATTRAYLDYIDIEVAVAGANGTSDHWACQLDTGVSRYSSGTVETFTPVNCNMQSTASPQLVAKGGPFVCTAETASVRRLGNGTFKSTIELTGDRYIFTFGEDPVPANKIAAAASTYYNNLGPVVLGSSDQLLLALYQVAQDTAGVYRVRIGWHER